MSIGNAFNAAPAQLNAQAGALAVNIRNCMEQVGNFTFWFNTLTQAQVQAAFGLPDLPTAAQMQTCVGLMFTLYGIYTGTVQQGGSGGTGATLENFALGLAPLWGGQ